LQDIRCKLPHPHLNPPPSRGRRCRSLIPPLKEEEERDGLF